MADIKPGQVWADNDERSMGRTLRVEAVEGGKAVCVILTNSNPTQAELDRGERRTQDTRGRKTRISLARFKPTNTGYRLIRDQQYGIRWGADNDVVFAYGSRALAEAALGEDGRSVGILVVHEYEPGTPNATEWREVEG